MSKRQREMDQKDRVKQREVRHAERLARKAAGGDTTGLDDLQFDADGRPIVQRDEDGMVVP